MTLGTLALARGLTYAYTEGGPLQPAAETRDIFVFPGRGDIFGIPTIGLIWLAIILITGAAVFLASSDADYIVAQTLNVAGGNLDELSRIISIETGAMTASFPLPGIYTPDRRDGCPRTLSTT